MSKLTKAEIKAHTAAIELLERGELSKEDALLVFKSYREDANHINSKAGAFFTPFGLARDLVFHIPYSHGQTTKIIDLCAGIGVLGYAAQKEQETDYFTHCKSEITCVEINPDYVEIGKKLIPSARWICGDALDPDLISSLGHFDFAISNPPFGMVESKYKKAYHGRLFEYMVIEAAAQIADGGAFIVPQMSAPFVYSGTTYRRWRDRCNATKFGERTGIDLEFNKGFDTTAHENEWHGVAPTCEIVCCDFTESPIQLSWYQSAG